MARGLSIISVRKTWPQLVLLTDEELAVMHNSGRAKRNPEFVYGINKEKEARGIIGKLPTVRQTIQESDGPILNQEPEEVR